MCVFYSMCIFIFYSNLRWCMTAFGQEMFLLSQTIFYSMFSVSNLSSSFIRKKNVSVVCSNNSNDLWPDKQPSLVVWITTVFSQKQKWQSHCHGTTKCHKVEFVKNTSVFNTRIHRLSFCQLTVRVQFLLIMTLTIPLLRPGSARFGLVKSFRSKIRKDVFLCIAMCTATWSNPVTQQ